MLVEIDWSRRLGDALWAYQTEYKTPIVVQRLNGFIKVDESRRRVYESSAIYKEKMDNYHDQNIEKHESAVGDLVLLFNSRMRLFPGKLKSKLTGPFLITKAFPHVAVKFWNKDSARFTVNGQIIKTYLGHLESVHEVVEVYLLDEV
nr:uncharacterized protein LOC101267459 [Solanum lycopersicum]